MADNIRATPRNEFLGLLADAMYGGLEYMKDPRRTQQMQGLAGLLESTGIPKTTERMAYGEDLTNIGRANVPLLKPETAEAMMTVAPLAPVAGKAAKGLARMYGSEINAAMMGERGGLLGAMTPQPKQIFIGESAKTWNKANADNFLKLEEFGVDPVDAWKQTGTFRSPDGKLRQEISDAKSMSGEKLYSWGEATDLQRGNSTIVRRQKALLHPELSAAYPDTKNIIVSLNPNRTGGYYEMERDIIGAPMIGENNAADKSLMLHELQHAIQQREGFAGGANPNAPYPAGVRKQMIRNQFEELKALTKYDPANPYSSPNTLTDEELLQMAIRNTDAENGVGRMQAYRLSPGEAEARAVENRMNMTTQERFKKFPLESYDVPVESLLFPIP
ncbi:hypothetical protein UFOVP588_13 [uncultured Caudovirales phage]|uniref:Uncharacterized protein n=1 Tax=uncultured Caudovirales phage TaxID=2100421 RepID=A0A6J5N272_9CAUD|nr:hypothetical protein UFOVP588_13 [uncultured Caudovirales phage]